MIATNNRCNRYKVSCDIKDMCEIPYNDDRSECSPLPLQKKREEK